MLRRWLGALLVAMAVGLGAGPALAQKGFVREDLAGEAARLPDRLRAEAAQAGVGRPAPQLRREGETALARGDARRALQLLTAALAADPNDAGAWLAFSRAALAVGPRDYTERANLQGRAVTAAYLAYQRAGTRADEATALRALAEAHVAQESWRPALDTYRASLGLADAPAVRQAYEALREKHGFRLLDYKVDSDAASPRICFQFSESLKPRTDFAPYVVVSGGANAAITAEDNQLCVDGVRHGERYTVLIRQGVPSAIPDEVLLRSADYEIYVRDRQPQARFTGRNYVLPRTGQEGIPVVTVNTEAVEIELSRIGDRSLLPAVREDFLTQLSRSRAQDVGAERGTKVWTGTLATRSELNQDVVTAFPVLEAVGRLEPGVYVMLARPRNAPARGDEEEARAATQWFVVSDLGLTALKGPGGVHVFVRSLERADPVEGVEVRLIARNNEVLATKATDRTGLAAFDAGLARGEGGLALGLAVATTAGGDYGFLDLAGAAFDLTDRGVRGRPHTGAVDAYLYTERGVYRSGETVHLTALLRDARGAAIPALPLTLVVKRPDGVEQSRVQVEDQGIGGRSLSLPLLPGAQRGTWRIAAYTDPKGPPVGETTFLVEDYVPERLEVTLLPRFPALQPGQPAEIDLTARFLYGAPSANLEVSGEVAVQSATGSGVKGLDGFVVGLEDEPVEANTAEIEERGRTDAGGQALMRVPVPALVAPRPTEAKVTLRVGEEGGRAVERSLTFPILPRGPVVGVRKNFGSDLAEGATATFDVVLAAPDGTRLSRAGLRWTLSRVERRYQWYNQDGRWGFEPVKATRRVADGAVDARADAPARISAPVESGTYRLEVRADGLETALTAVGFQVGWSGDQTADVPDLLDMSLDKSGYRAGETMQVRLNPRFQGRATLMVVGTGVHDIRLVDVSAAGTTVSIPVRPEWGAGAYLVALAHRPLDQAARRLPGRALGLAWFEVDRAARRLDVRVDAPERIRPRGPLTLPVRVAGLQPGEQARITVAAVDVGILNLTRYQAPNPLDHFFGQKQLSAEIRDLYGYLIDGMQGTRGAIRSGGDAGLRGDAIPPTQEPLARYSGLVAVGPDGTATVTFDVPAFNGTARVMAVAWSASRVGSASTDVVIRDPVVLAGTLPRFLNVGDQSRFHMAVDNVEGPAGDYTVDLDIRGPVVVPAEALRRTIRLERGGRGSLTIPVAAAGPGTAQIDVRLLGPGIEAGQSFTLRMQPGTSALVRREVRPLEPGASLTLTSDLLADILPGTGAVSLSVSPLAALDVPTLLQSLDRYPYGCTEQIVSRALPLLYVNRLATAEALALDGRATERVREAVERVLARQGSDGSFGLWSAGGSDTWLDAYAADFLTRARERGLAVPQPALNQALDRLRNFVANAADVEANGAELAYAAYVLARNGRPVMGDLRYLADTKLGQLATPLARGQVGAGLGLLGDRRRAESALGSAVDALRRTRDAGAHRPDYGTRLRDGAGLLALVAESGLSGEAVRPIAQVLAEERASSRATSTQENAWMVLAAQALQQEAGALRLTLDGAAQSGALYRTYRADGPELRPVNVANTGTTAAQAVVGVTGSPIGPEPAASQGYDVERVYYRLDGTRVDTAQLRQNDRLVAVLKVTEREARAARLLLVDRLPAGFEIDNPKLVDSGTVGALPWLKTDVEPAHAEYRDDRFVAAFDRTPDQPAIFTVAYMVRAVAPGRYVHPGAHVEDMYRPERYGRTAFGQVEIVDARR